MQLPASCHRAQLSRALVGALATLSFPALSFAAPNPQVVTAEVFALPGAATGIDSFSSVAADGEGSWVASANLLGGGPGSSAIYGFLAGSGATGPSVLRVPQPLSGLTQETIFRPEVQGGRVAYTSFAQPSIGGFSSWIDDTVIAAEGIPIGTSGLAWGGSSTPMLSSGQNFYVRGFAQPIGGGPARHVVVRYPAEEIVLESGTSVAFLNSPVKAITSFDPSPSGTAWAATITYDSNTTGQEQEAVIVNGNVLALTPGAGLALTENTDFESFNDVEMNDAAEVIFSGVDSQGPVIYRRRRPAIRSTASTIVGVDARSRVVTFDRFVPGHGAQFEGLSLDRPGVASVDADGDGLRDPGWSLEGTGVSFGGAGFLENGELLVVADVQVPGVGVERAIVKTRLLLPDDVVCDGEPNSSGVAASLRAVGSDVPSFNDLQLRATSLPPSTVLLPLMSRITGFVANPAGSEGNLCLSGSIGRGTIVVVGSAGPNATFRVLPAALAQPNGFVAALAGETWTFQAWYRDVAAGQATSNFTSATSVTFR